MHDLKLIDLKSRDCHVLRQQSLLVEIHGILLKNVRHIINLLWSFFNLICRKPIDLEKLDALEERIG